MSVSACARRTRRREGNARSNRARVTILPIGAERLSTGTAAGLALKALGAGALQSAARSRPPASEEKLGGAATDEGAASMSVSACARRTRRREGNARSNRARVTILPIGAERLSTGTAAGLALKALGAGALQSAARSRPPASIAWCIGKQRSEAVHVDRSLPDLHPWLVLRAMPQQCPDPHCSSKKRLGVLLTDGDGFEVPRNRAR